MKNFRFSRIACSLGLCLLSGSLISQAQTTPDYLNLTFSTASGYNPDYDIWITFNNGGGLSPTTFDVTYNGGQAVTFGTYVDSTTGQTLYNALSNPIKLSDLSSAGFKVSSVSSVAVFVSYGTSFSNLSVAPGFTTGAVSANVPYQNFEITRTGGAGDQGNLTNINYFTAPLGITSYSSGKVIQQTGFSQTAAQIGPQLAALSTGNAYQMNGTGPVIRYIGPSTFATNVPYQSFQPYLASVNKSGVTNQIVKANAFNSSDNSTNYNFQINYTSSVDSNGDIKLTGNITTTIKNNATGQTTSGPTFAGATVVISGANQSVQDAIIYGQAFGQYTSAMTWGAGWAAFQTYVNSVLPNSNAYNITQNLAVGEITSAILMGFLGNTTKVMFNGVETPLNQLQSQQWWTLDPLVAFDAIQSNPDYYNQWANVIYSASDNGSYSIPYSDRLGTGPLVNTVQYNLDGTNYAIDTWNVEIGAPLAVPEGDSFLYLGIAGALFAGARFIRRSALA